jgi:hypothetical protein
MRMKVSMRMRMRMRLRPIVRLLCACTTDAPLLYIDTTVTVIIRSAASSSIEGPQDLRQDKRQGWASSISGVSEHGIAWECMEGGECGMSIACIRQWLYT